MSTADRITQIFNAYPHLSLQVLKTMVKRMESLRSGQTSVFEPSLTKRQPPLAVTCGKAPFHHWTGDALAQAARDATDLYESASRVAAALAPWDEAHAQRYNVHWTKGGGGDLFVDLRRPSDIWNSRLEAGDVAASVFSAQVGTRMFHYAPALENEADLGYLAAGANISLVRNR